MISFYSFRFRPQVRRTAGGFTLLEMLLVLALLVLLGGLVAGASLGILRRADTPGLAGGLREALLQGREMALFERRPVWLSFDSEARHYVLRSGDERVRIPIEGGGDIVFLRDLAENHSVLIGGVLVESRDVESVRLFPDGTCETFRVQFRFGRDTERWMIDPWTCAPILAEAEGRR